MSCWSALSRQQMPCLLLANSLWIGDVPLKLQIITLPKCILVMRYFPAAYIIKLYPKIALSRAGDPCDPNLADQPNHGPSQSKLMNCLLTKSGLAWPMIARL